MGPRRGCGQRRCGKCRFSSTGAAFAFNFKLAPSRFAKEGKPLWEHRRSVSVAWVLRRSDGFNGNDHEAEGNQINAIQVGGPTKWGNPYEVRASGVNHLLPEHPDSCLPQIFKEPF
jgi:hypothetical protein